MRKRADGTKVYGITYTNPDGRTIRKKVGPSKALAEDALNAVRTDMARSVYHLSPVIRSPTFKAFTKKYVDHAKTEKRSWRLDVECLKPLTAHFGARALDRITPFYIEQYRKKRLERVSPRTVNIELSILRRMFRLARTWSLMGTDPLDGVKRLKEPEKSVRILSPEEETRLLAAAPAHLRDLIILALNTGLRLGELRQLAAGDVDLEVGALTVRQSKTDRVRHVPLNQKARAVVERGLADGFPTILHYQGQPIGNVHRSWYKAIKKAKLPGLRIHDLRHTFATRAVLRSHGDLARVALLLGHSSVQMTMRYSHPAPADLKAVVDLLDDPPTAHPLPTKSKRATRRRVTR
jgi:integrase